MTIQGDTPGGLAMLYGLLASIGFIASMWLARKIPKKAWPAIISVIVVALAVAVIFDLF